MVRELLAISCILLYGCQQVHHVQESHWSTSEKEYLKSATNSRLKLPSGLELPKDSGSVYPDLPQNLPAPGSLKSVPLEPPGFGKLESSN